MTTVLDTRSKDTILGTIAAGMQGRLPSRILNFAKGKVFRALGEAYAGVGLWLQKENLQIVLLTRLATCEGGDIDTFIADWPLSGVTRLGAQAATGTCQFGRYTAGPTVAYVPVGGQVRTVDGTQTFEVTADARNPAFVASYGAAGGYALQAQVATVTAPVIGITNGLTGAPGANSNVAGQTIGLIASSMPGVDTVTNPAAFTNGFDQEGDDSVKARFALAVAGRTGGTVPAYLSAIANLRVGLTCRVIENQNLDGTPNDGMVTVIVDDGSGNLSADLLALARSAITGPGVGVRAAGVRVGVYPAVLAPINVVMQIAVLPGYVRQDVIAAVVAALALHINGRGQGRGVSYFKLAAVAEAVPGCDEIRPNTFTLNGGTADVAGSAQATPKANNIIVS